jgi:hypothetical protein
LVLKKKVKVKKTNKINNAISIVETFFSSYECNTNSKNAISEWGLNDIQRQHRYKLTIKKNLQRSASTQKDNILVDNTTSVNNILSITPHL